MTKIIDLAEWNDDATLDSIKIKLAKDIHLLNDVELRQVIDHIIQRSNKQDEMIYRMQKALEEMSTIIESVVVLAEKQNKLEKSLNTVTKLSTDTASILGSTIKEITKNLNRK